MDQKEIEEKLKNFQVNILKSRKKRKNSHYPIIKGFASSGNMRRKSSLESEESGKGPNGKISVRRITFWPKNWRAEIISS